MSSSKARKATIQSNLLRVDGVLPQQRIAKHRKMASSPFLFFRGSAPLFYDDIAANVLKLPTASFEVPLTYVMGDCHTSNFGFITEEGSHTDKVIFAANDFDDACVGHAIWDIARYITSLYLCQIHCNRVVSGKINSEKDYSHKKSVTELDATNAALSFINQYLSVCANSIADAEYLQHAIEHFPEQHILYKRYQKALERSAGGASFQTESTLSRAIEWVDDKLRIKRSDNSFNSVEKSLCDDIKNSFSPYVDDHILDVAERLNAGTGSVNMPRYYLLVGPKNATKSQLNLCHLVEIKQQRSAAPLHNFADCSPVNRLNPAHLTVNSQRRMQRSPDMILDDIIWQGNHWLVRSRHHAKVGVKPEQIAIGKKALKGGFAQYAGSCGKALALSHCRGDKRSVAFEESISQLLLRDADTIIDACQQYANQVLADCQLLQQMINTP
jgi:hypothetical protein